MINFNEIDNKIENIYMSNGIENSTIKPELSKSIIHEFQKDFIKKLYPNPLWTNRVYWNVIGKIQNEHEDISLDDIISETDNHLMANNLRPSTMSQRDTIKFIHDTIMHLQADNNATITTISSSAIEVGIPTDRLESAIKRMKADGSIFETTEGFYRCI